MAQEKIVEDGGPDDQTWENRGSFWDEADLETLAAQQGIKPIADPRELHGDFWPEDDSIDEFMAAVRQWRREGG